MKQVTISNKRGRITTIAILSLIQILLQVTIIFNKVWYLHKTIIYDDYLLMITTPKLTQAHVCIHQ